MNKIESLRQKRNQHALAIANAGGIEQAISFGALPQYLDTTLSEAIVLGLLRQNVSTFFTVFGHGSTEIGEVLRIYQKHGLVRVLGLRSEIEASHAAAALRWAMGQKSAVVTSIGPGALQAMAASLVSASDGIGVWYLFGDETTEDEGFNMQQIPRHHQNQFLQLTATMGQSYSLHTPLSLPTALRRGLNAVDHPYKAGPFYLLLPMNTQAAALDQFNLRELPHGAPPKLGAASAGYKEAAQWITEAERVVLKIGGGARGAEVEIRETLVLADGVAVLTPIATGIVPFSNPRCMVIGGSKGSLCGNYAMDAADLLIAIGTRAVCQSDSSRTGYPNVKRVINVNADINDALHYQDTLALVGDIRATLQQLNIILKSGNISVEQQPTSNWLQACTEVRNAWQEFKAERYANPILFDAFWNQPVLTQPAAIKVATDWAKEKGALTFFDAGDVQANGFQIVEDETPGQTFTETGASYMGFAVSALLASAVSENPFYGLALTGDGSFTMSPQVLIDGAEFGARGCVLLFDNNRMAAISGLQKDQYQREFATHHVKPIDYLSWAKAVPGVLALPGGNTAKSLRSALETAFDHPGVSLIHLPVYYGENELGGLGVFGRWNVGNWVEETQKLRHKIGL